MVSKCKDSYNRSLFFLNRSNSHKTWNVINNLANRKHNNAMLKRIISNNVGIINSFDIVEIFNEYFCNIAGALDRNFLVISKSSLDHVKQWFPTFQI